MRNINMLDTLWKNEEREREKERERKRERGREREREREKAHKATAVTLEHRRRQGPDGRLNEDNFTISMMCISNGDVY